MSETSLASPEAIEPSAAIRLLLGIARLGEADLAGWWSSQGMNASVAFSLAGFRRTSAVIGAELAVLSATRRHRQVLPRDTVVHLFSPHLPYARWTRAYLMEQKTALQHPMIDELLRWKTEKVARDGLRRWSDELEVVPSEVVTVSSADLEDQRNCTGLLIRFAKDYVSQHGELSVPHVELAK